MSKPTSEQKREWNRRYRESHREELRQQAHDYYHNKTTPEQRARWTANSLARDNADREAVRASRRRWYANLDPAAKAARSAKINAQKRESYRVDIEKSRAEHRARYRATIERRRADAKRYVERHYDEVRRKGREMNRRGVSELRDWYVRMLLGPGSWPKELIAVKREWIKLRRACGHDKRRPSKSVFSQTDQAARESA